MKSNKQRNALINTLLQRIGGRSGITQPEGVTVVKARDDQYLYKELSSILSQIQPDLSDVIW